MSIITKKLEENTGNSKLLIVLSVN